MMWNLFCAILLQINLFSSNIDKLVKQYLSGPQQNAVGLSVSIRSEATGNEVYSRQSSLNMQPASTLKLITTATALEYLSPSYKLETMVYSSGKLADGKVQGDIYLEAIGDPTFGSKRFTENPFAQILQIFRDNEIYTVEGEIKVKNNERNDFPLDWLAGDIGNYYGAFSNNFNFAENLYTVYFNGGTKVGDPVGIGRIYPFDTNWKIRNEVKTGEPGSGDRVNILNLPFSNDILMVGTVPLNSRNFAVKGAVPNSNKIFTDSLKTFLRNNGVLINEKLLPEEQQNEELGSVISPDIARIAKETNYESVNIFADGLANYMWEADAEDYDSFLKEFWKEKGVDLTSNKFIDGSGLSPMNLVSTGSMTAVLHQVKKNTAFREGIPIVGKNGTVANLGKTTKGQIAAKSGSIMGVRNYAGYFTADNGKKYSFSIFMNGINGNQYRSQRQFFEDFFRILLTIRE